MQVKAAMARDPAQQWSPQLTNDTRQMVQQRSFPLTSPIQVYEQPQALQ